MHSESCLGYTLDLHEITTFFVRGLEGGAGIHTTRLESTPVVVGYIRLILCTSYRYLHST